MPEHEDSIDKKSTQLAAANSHEVTVRHEMDSASKVNSGDLDDCVPFFMTKKEQLKVELAFLVSAFIVAVGGAIVVRYKVEGPLRTLWLAAIGGFLGGWTFDAKWFYRVTARGKDDQHPHKWQKHKFYWRIFIPFVAGLISFSIYLLASSGVLLVNIKDPHSGRTSFGLCFFMGLFTDVILSKIATWAEKVIPGGSGSNQ